MPGPFVSRGASVCRSHHCRPDAPSLLRAPASGAAATLGLPEPLSRRRPTRQNCPRTGRATCARPPIPRRPRPTGGHALAVSTGARSARRARLIWFFLDGRLSGQPPTSCRFSQRSHAAMTMRAISPTSRGSLTNSGIVNAAVVPSSRTSGTVRCPVSGSNSKEPYVNQGDRSVRNTSDTCSGTRLTATDANRARGRRSRERSRWRWSRWSSRRPPLLSSASRSWLLRNTRSERDQGFSGLLPGKIQA